PGAPQPCGREGPGPGAPADYVTWYLPRRFSTTEDGNVASAYASSSYSMPGMWVTERTVQVPLDWAAPDGERIDLFMGAGGSGSAIRGSSSAHLPAGRSRRREPPPRERLRGLARGSPEALPGDPGRPARHGLEHSDRGRGRAGERRCGRGSRLSVDVQS